jgi:hypothetical protein
MLEGTNSSGKFKVQVSWTPNDIGKDNLFGVKFFDAASGSEYQTQLTLSCCLKAGST